MYNSPWYLSWDQADPQKHEKEPLSANCIKGLEDEKEPMHSQELPAKSKIHCAS